MNGSLIVPVSIMLLLQHFQMGQWIDLAPIPTPNNEQLLTIVEALNTGTRGTVFTDKALRDGRTGLGVHSDSSLLAGSGKPFGDVAKGDGGNTGSDDRDDNGVGGPKVALAPPCPMTTGSTGTATPEGAGGSGSTFLVPPAHGGAGSWSHGLLDAATAAARSAAQVDFGTGLNADGFPTLARRTDSMVD
ncbi:unnamed protein product [Penicillium discolor]